MKKLLTILTFIGLVAAGCNDSNAQSSNYSGRNNSWAPDDKAVLTRDEAIQDHWDEIRGYLSGSETLNVCSEESGNCYDLDADISDGQVEQIQFPNGGYLDFAADIDENGEASDIDTEGRGWDFTLDMDSGIVNDALSNWASDNNYNLE